MLAEHRCDGAADDVLKSRRHGRQNHHDEDERSAASQHEHARAKPDRRKEGILQGNLQRRVELESRQVQCPEQREERGGRKAADDWSRDVVAGENGDLPLDPVAGEQHHAGKRDGLDEV